MTFRQATQILAGKANGSRSDALDTAKAEVLKHSEKGKGGTIANIGDWLNSQGWSGKETAQEVAAEWDADEE